MRRILLFGFLALATVGFTRSQRQPYRVVFDLTSQTPSSRKRCSAG